MQLASWLRPPLSYPWGVVLNWQNPVSAVVSVGVDVIFESAKSTSTLCGKRVDVGALFFSSFSCRVFVV
ncbi:MAG: hypothetical protein MK097_18110, partial [Dechloromonas sp.]|nr:hypothetical protein [Dechloromonas sp.]